jgi:hypothetical protein
LLEHLKRLPILINKVEIVLKSSKEMERELQGNDAAQQRIE